MEKYLFDTTIIRLSDHERFHICLLLTFVSCSSSCLFAFFRCNYFVVSDFSFLFLSNQKADRDELKALYSPFFHGLT